MAARKRRAPRSEGELTRAGAVIEFIEKFLLVSEGARVGKPVELLDFQKEIIRGSYDDDTRRAIVSFGRKNGKTSLTAMLLLAHLVGPVWRRNAQIFSAAQSWDQAAIVFNLGLCCIERRARGG
jgi:phage terminase large subunit-like protein